MQSRQPNVSYRFYATLLDSYTNYLNSNIIWEAYWGFSDNPPHTPEEFKQKQFQDLIDRINRVPFESEAAAKGTAFNEIVDAMIEHRAPGNGVSVEKIWDRMDMTGEPAVGAKVTALKANIKTKQSEYVFVFDIAMCREFANYYKGALTQQFVKGIVHTRFGDVEVYGYVDELMPQSIHDIKTTGRYSVGKFKDHWQHHVYPYCYNQQGIFLPIFEYNVAQIDKYGNWETFTETYNYRPEETERKLVEICEDFICFLNENRHLITDLKIFNMAA